MKNTFFTIFRILLIFVLIGKILNWVLRFSLEINILLNIAMFSLIGTAYLVIGYFWDNKLTKIIITACGLFLIAMNFFQSSTPINIIAIICMLTPMFIARFYKKKESEINTQETKI